MNKKKLLGIYGESSFLLKSEPHLNYTTILNILYDTMTSNCFVFSQSKVVYSN